MGLIEQAARRLEELKRAGIEPPPGIVERAAAKQAQQAQVVAPPAAAPEVVPANSPQAVEPEAEAPKVQSAYIAFDLKRMAAEGFITPDIPNSQIADEFRIIKRPLLANVSSAQPAPVRHANLIMVTSSVPGEGKTFSAINLAISIATELDRRVLLVDADIVRPSLPRALGLPTTLGMLDVLEGKKVPLHRALYRTNVEKLTFLASGTQSARAAEVLASDAMSSFLEELATRYDDRIVVFDSPPLLATTEARVLASHMGQILFVVHAEKTLQSDVKRALATIESCPIKLLMLNRAKTAGQGAYGYGYGYGYGR
jgi:protein-tyrosine kinase